MAVALRGNLEDFGIADVFQLIGQQRKTGVLEFRGERGCVQLRFDRGAVVSAAPAGSYAEEALAEMLVRCGRLQREQVDRLAPECAASALTVPRMAVERGWLAAEDLDRIEDLLTRETFFEVLRWERGDFDFHAQAVEHARRFESLLGAEQILMDGLRMVDEWHSFSELVPSQEDVFQKRAGFDEYRRRTQLDSSQFAAAERVFQLVDGRIPVRRIIDLSLLGTFDAVRLLADLRRHGVIEPLGPEAVERLRGLASARARLGAAHLASGLAALAALALLAAVAAWTLATGPAADTGPGLPLPGGALAALQSAYEARAVRNALESRRFVDDRWPADLSELETRGLLAPGSLAARGGAPYYYARREAGVLVLAPER